MATRAEDGGRRERRDLLYSGRVQGVGFRYATREIAARFAVAGYVQNLPDGSVRLVAEGDRDELERFLAAVGAELERYIADVRSRAAEATGEFAEFQIEY